MAQSNQDSLFDEAVALLRQAYHALDEAPAVGLGRDKTISSHQLAAKMGVLLREIDPPRTKAEMDAGHLSQFVADCDTWGCD